MNNTYPQARTADLVISELPDEVLVYDLKTHQAHCLNKTAALIWHHCDGRRTVAEITQAIEVAEHTLLDETAVWAALEQLNKSGLLAASVKRPSGIPSLSRRRAMQKMGLSAAGAFPLVMSIVAPAAAQACTGLLPLGASCSPNNSFGAANMCCTQCCSGAGSMCVVVGLGVGQFRGNGTVCTMNSDCCSNNCDTMGSGNCVP